MPRKKPVRAKQVADFLCTVGVMLANMGTPCPRLDSHGKRFKMLSNLFRACGKEDPPPDWVKSVPIQLVEHAVNALQANATMTVQLRHAIAGCIVIGCFFCFDQGSVCAPEATTTTPSTIKTSPLSLPMGLSMLSLPPKPSFRQQQQPIFCLQCKRMVSMAKL